MARVPGNLFAGNPAAYLAGGNGGMVSQNQLHVEVGADTNDSTPGPDRTVQTDLAPAGMEHRVMVADRVKGLMPFALAGNSYASIDPQKGGAPGARGSDPSGHGGGNGDSFISSNVDPTSIATNPGGVPGGIPKAQIKLNYGASDWTSPQPTALPAHLKIAIAQNPNAAQRNVGLWAAEGQMANTKYESPAPWAAGSFIG